MKRSESPLRKLIGSFVVWVGTGITIIGAITIGLVEILGWLSVEASLLIAINTTILGILASLAVSNNLNLAKQATFIETLSKQLERGDLANYVIKVRNEPHSVNNFVNNAKKVFICDAFFSSFVVDKTFITKLIESGCDVSIAVINPNEQKLMDYMTELNKVDANPTNSIQMIVDTTQKAYDEIKIKPAKQKRGYGTLELFYINSIIPFSCILVDGEMGILTSIGIRKKARVLVELIPFQFDGSEIHRHHFNLTEEENVELFKSYRNSIIKLFENPTNKKLVPPPSP